MNSQGWIPTNNIHYFFVHRYFHDSFDKVYKATIGVDFMCQQYKILGIPFKIQVLVFSKAFLVEHLSAWGLMCACAYVVYIM